MIMSLDGGSTVDGRTAALGNAADVHLFALLRDLAEVILVGSGTVKAERYGGIRYDSERANRRRRWGLPATPPPLAVVTNRGLDPRLPLFTDTVVPPIVVTTAEAAVTVPAGVPVIVTGDDTVDLPAALADLAGRGLRRISCEGGPGLLGSLTALGLIDEYCLTLAPMMVGAGALPPLPVPLASPIRWHLESARVDGDHLFTRYRRRPRVAAGRPG